MGIAGDIVLIIVAAFLGGLVAHKLKQPLLVGYILAGVAIGPHTAGPTVVASHDIELLAEIGVALLLFALGVEVSLRDLKPVKWIALIGGPLQIGLTTLFGYGVAQLLGFSASESVWFGAMVSLSSTMVVLKGLASSGQSSTLASRIMIAILVIQDLAVVPMLIILPKLKNTESIAGDLAIAFVQAALFLLTMLLVGTRLIPYLFRLIVGWKSRELFLVSAVALAVGVGYGTYLLGLSFALGAFVAGMVLSESELSHQVLADVVPLRDIFGLLFFVSVGMLFNPADLISNWPVVLTICALVIIGKFGILYGITSAFGYVNKAPTIVGLGLAQIGEFSFVLARTGLNGGYLSTELYSSVISATVVTLVLSPLLLKFQNPVHRVLSSLFPRKIAGAAYSPIVPELENHVVIVGFGRTGQAVRDVLLSAKVPQVIVDTKHALTKKCQDVPFIWGDATKPEILSAAAVQTARCLVVTIPRKENIRLTIERARYLNENLNIVSRTANYEEAEVLKLLGVANVIQPEHEAGIALAQSILGYFDYSKEAADDLCDALRESSVIDDNQSDGREG